MSFYKGPESWGNGVRKDATIDSITEPAKEAVKSVLSFPRRLQRLFTGIAEDSHSEQEQERISSLMQGALYGTEEVKLAARDELIKLGVDWKTGKKL